MQMSRSPSHHISSLRSGGSLNSLPNPHTPPTVNITPIIRPSSHNVAPNPHSPSTHPSHHPVSQPASPDHRNNHGGLTSHTQSHYVSPTPTRPSNPNQSRPSRPRPPRKPFPFRRPSKCQRRIPCRWQRYASARQPRTPATLVRCSCSCDGTGTAGQGLPDLDASIPCACTWYLLLLGSYP